MKATCPRSLMAAVLVGALTTLAGMAFAQSSRWDELSKLPFKESYPTPEASARLYDELQFQRAVQVYLWALPAMNMVAMRDGQAATFGGGNNVLAIWKDRPNAKTIITTANPDVIYGLAFVDLKDGPVVFEAAADTKPQAMPIDVVARPVGKADLLPGGYRQVILMNAYGNNDYYLHVPISKLALAISKNWSNTLWR